MNRPFLRALLLGAFLLVLHREARADLRLPTYSEEHPVQTGLIGAALALVVAAAGFLTLKMASDRKARWSITALIFVLALLAAIGYWKLFRRPPKTNNFERYMDALTLRVTNSDDSQNGAGIKNTATASVFRAAQESASAISVTDL